MWIRESVTNQKRVAFMSLFHDILCKYVVRPCSEISKHCLPFKLYKTVRYAFFDVYYSKKVAQNGFVVKKQKNGVSVRKQDLSVFGLNTNIIMHVNNIMVNDCYHFDKGHDTQWSVLDIGMNMGVASLYFAQNPNIERVYAYEPFTPTYNLGVKNLKANPRLARKIVPHNYGLGNKHSVIELPYDIEMSGCCSSIPEKQNKVFGKKKCDKEKICICSAAQELKSILDKDKNNIMLKIDCEGSEREIIRDLYKNGLLSSVQAIAMEYHDGIYKPLIEMMEKSGFSVSYREKKVSKTTGMIYAYNLKQR